MLCVLISFKIKSYNCSIYSFNVYCCTYCIRLKYVLRLSSSHIVHSTVLRLPSSHIVQSTVLRLSSSHIVQSTVLRLSSSHIVHSTFFPFQELLTRHKHLCAEFLESNYENVFNQHYQKLLNSENYVTRRQALKVCLYISDIKQYSSIYQLILHKLRNIYLL